MSEKDEEPASNDSTVDAIAALALVAIVVAAAIYWVSHQ
jgi:hypothetical protein